MRLAYLSKRQRPAISAHSRKPNDDILAFVYETSAGIDGFVIASLRNHQECSIDDFAIADESQWQTIGASLLRAAGEEAASRNINQYIVVCGHLDQPKRAMLSKFGLTIDRYWYTAAVDTSMPAIEPQIRAAIATDAPKMSAVVRQVRPHLIVVSANCRFLVNIIVHDGYFKRKICEIRPIC